MPLYLFSLVIFQTGSLDFFPGPSLDHHPFTYTSFVTGVTGRYHHAWIMISFKSILHSVKLYSLDIEKFLLGRGYQLARGRRLC
jgi:hypothetical protein